jgi:Trypsin
MRKLVALTCAIFALAAAGAQAIVGGTAPSRAYPHMGALYNEGDFYCGSSLVRDQWVLTAAHCVEGEEPTKYSVQLGTTKRSQGGETIPVIEGIVHEEYDPDTVRNDVALLKLARPVAYAPVRIAAPGEEALYAAGTQVTAIGWGSTDPNLGGPTDDLREVVVPFRSEGECEMSTMLAADYDPQTMACAGETLGGEDTCYGDSGGPLMATSGALTLVGATSFGLSCGLPLSYGVYARLINLRAWADSKLPASSADPDPTPTPGPGGTPPSSGEDRRVQIYLPASLGSARKARRRGRVTVNLRASGPVTAVKVTLKRGRRLLGRAGAERIVGRRAVRVKVRKARVRRGKVRLAVSARDGRGRRVTATGRPRFSR